MHGSVHYEHCQKPPMAIDGGFVPAPCAIAAAIGDCGHVIEIAALSQRLSGHVVNKAGANCPEERRPIRAVIRSIARFSHASAITTLTRSLLPRTRPHWRRCNGLRRFDLVSNMDVHERHRAVFKLKARDIRYLF